MADKHTYSGRTASISTAAQNTALADATAAAALTYTEIGGPVTIGAFGPNTNMMTLNTLDNAISNKQKGVTDLGTASLEVARDDTDAGQVLMRAAGAPTNSASYVLKVINQDTSIDYLRGPIGGPTNKGGGVEDFDLDTYTIGINQQIHVVPA